MDDFIPVLIISVVLLIITILLSIADQLLVSYGQCKITVRQDEEVEEFIVEGGDYLHRSLIENGVNITTSCGGKSSCGYCKVRLLSGGGPILPTEEVFMDRQEKLSGMRLACQVKVKDDIEVFIPDFLTTVRGIVKNKSYDPKMRWQFRYDDQPDCEIAPAVTKLEEDEKQKINAIIGQQKDRQGALVPILQGLDKTFNYLPEPVLRYTSSQLGRPMSELYRVATFYNAFEFKPRGKYVISICLGTACHVKGAADILDTFERELGIKKGETTEDMLFTLDAVMCIGCCGLAPVLKVNDDVHGLMTKKKVVQLIKQYREA